MTSKETPTVSVRKSTSVKRASKSLRESKYDPILEKLGKLKPGNVLVVDLPKDVTPRQMQVRLAYIEDRRIKQGLLKIRSGYRISHYETVDGKLAIELVKR